MSLSERLNGILPRFFASSAFDNFIFFLIGVPAIVLIAVPAVFRLCSWGGPRVVQWLTTTPDEGPAHPEKAGPATRVASDAGSAESVGQVQKVGSKAIGSRIVMSVGATILLFLALVIRKTAGLIGADAMLPQRLQSLPKKLKRVAEDANPRLPAMINANTRLDRVIAESGNRISYQYTILDLGAGGLSAEAIGERAAKIKSEVCSRTGRKMLEQGIIMEYHYSADDGRRVAQFDVSLADCLPRPNE